MGFFSKITKGIKKVVGGVTNSAKKVLSSGLGKVGLEGVGTYFGLPGVGTALSSFLGGESGLSDLAGTGLQAYLTKRGQDQTFQQQLESQQIQNAAYRANAKYAADLSQAAANKQMNFQNASNAKQMQFQYRMSNTAHQREVQDLRKAGLNPILSGTGGMGATTPAGASGSGAMGVVTAAPVVNEAGAAAASAMEIFKTMSDALRAQAETQYTKEARTALTEAQTTGTYAAAQEAGARTQLHLSAEALNRARTGLTETQQRNLNQEYENLKVVNANLRATGLLTLEQRKQVQQATANLAETWKDLKMKGDISASEYGKLMEMGKRATDVAGLNEILSTIKALKGGKK